jgi:hypothetical protein
MLAIAGALLPGTAITNGAGDGDPAQLTDLEEVVMYAIDADTYELLRYNFDTDEFVRIGVVTDQDANIVTDAEGLAFIPHGPYKGIYAGANYYEDQPSKLVKINPMDSTGWVYPADVGFEKVEGLVAFKDTDTGDWFLYATTKHQSPGDKRYSLIKIDPATGRGSLVFQTSKRYQGLAADTTFTVLWGSTEDPAELWLIDPRSHFEQRLDTIVDPTRTYTKVEGLEYALGDDLPGIKIPLQGHEQTVPDSWTGDGVLFAFDDDADALLIVNRITAEARVWPCSFNTIDAEGLVFTTKRRDPWGAIVVDACD